MRFIRRICPLLFLCCILAGLAAACESEQASPEPPVFEKKQAVERAFKSKRIFAIVYATSDIFYKAVTKTAEEASQRLGGQLIVKAPDEANVEQQIRMMENLIKQHVDGIAISPVDADALTPYINKAVQAGIRVVCFDNDAPKSKRLAYIGIDNYETGRKLAAQLANDLGGQGMVIAETGQYGFTSIQQRMAGFKDYLSRLPDIQLLEDRTNGDNLDRAITNLETMIDAHPHFDAFVGLDTLAGSAAILVWKAKGLSQIAITTNDLPDLLDGVKNEQISAVLSLQEGAWGEHIINTLNDAGEGKAIQELNLLEPILITKENLGSYQGKQ
ncbi:sugar ABC transporter substrate-binding protein [Paenibacillus sp. GCM10027628]|uniref:sugar ABC transporter substrate-binding protein n=1 Tax=Paenibacillus sp. GCM10027628 TaxID=3273413 RepID=UPI0036411C94